ncbi:MAG: CusA/CzcA family heavy metal efflux RND transporter [Saprospiraceae bacterium]|nr:CusA/CzcA family heavy metal efflux RND transporter [Saprospiraceae bacterium]
MFLKIIAFSLENKLLVLLGVLGLIVIGIYSANKIPLDAVPDITNNQVQIVTTSPTLAPQEIEQLVTYPIEAAMTNIPNVLEVRSISRYGLSVVTVVLAESVPVMLARQYVQEQLNVAKSSIPTGLGEPELMPITTGLGEIYQYVLTVDPAYEHLYDATELRTIQDWQIKRQLNGVPGIIEVSSFGGNLKQYEVAVHPELLLNFGLTIQDVIVALETNNENSGGSYIEQGPHAFYIRTEGRTLEKATIEQIVVNSTHPAPVLVKDIATVQIGSAKRYGAMTMDGKGEVVGGITLMFKGANSSEALANVKQRMETVQAGLPKGVNIYPYLDRSRLVEKTIDTATRNLVEGGLIVVFVLLLLLGNFRAGLIVASIIPLSMLFALTMMRLFGVSANLMSLGAIDFGIVVDGAVIIVEGLLHTLAIGFMGQKLTQIEMNEVVRLSTNKIYRAAAFGVFIILVVFIPILTLEGTEGKMFRPMAQTVGFAIVGSLLLSITYVPVMSALFINKKIRDHKNWSDQIIESLKWLYQPLLKFALRLPMLTLLAALALFVATVFLLSRMGAEFIPTLDEGDFAMQQQIKAGSSLKESIHTSTKAEALLLAQFPEVQHVVSKIGTAEVPTDPMAIEDADIMIILKDKSEWVSATSREELMQKMGQALEPITWASFEFTQPIQLRFNELMTGSKSDVAIKLFGEDMAVLKEYADKAAALIEPIEGASDIKVAQIEGLQQLVIHFNRQKIAQYGLNISDLNQIIRAAYAGEIVGNVFEQERKFDLVVRLAPAARSEMNLNRLTITTPSGMNIPLSEVAEVRNQEGSMLIEREQARRFISISINVRNRDVASLVTDIQTVLAKQLSLPPGYEIQYGGQFENLENAKKRLAIAVPVALLLILLLLYLAFGNLKDALIIFIAVPLSAIGGIIALQLRGLPFSISSGIGFIALFGVSVLNGIVLLSAIKQLNSKDFETFKDLITHACLTRLRPVLMTALVAALGFIPMALSDGSGAEVQRPLATVVIGGLVSSTLLTLLILPTLYWMTYQRSWKVLSVAAAILCSVQVMPAQKIENFEGVYQYALENHPLLKNKLLDIQKEQLNTRAIGAFEPLQIDYLGGQINYAKFDHQLTVNQSLDNLLNQKNARQVVDAKVAVLNNEQGILKNELRFDLLQRYENWKYQQAMLRLWRDMENTYQTAYQKLQAQFQAGEIDQVALALLQNELLQIQHAARQAATATNTSLVELKISAYLPDSVMVIEDDFRRLAMPNLQYDTTQSQYWQSFTLKQNVLAVQSTYLLSEANKPNIRIGYFLQSLEKDFAFQGVMAGVSMPLDKSVTKIQAQQLRLEQVQLQHERDWVAQQLQKRLAILQLEIKSNEAMLVAFETSFLATREAQFSKLTLQLEQGEIDFFRFSQLARTLLETEQLYFDVLQQHNQAVLEWIYITQK